MLETIDSYIYTGISFSTFSFDEASLLCVKYALSKFRKKKYRILLKDALIDAAVFYPDEGQIQYFLHGTLKALRDATLLLGTNKKEIRLAEKFLGREVPYSRAFKIIDLSSEIRMKKACFIVQNREEKHRYRYVIDYFDRYAVLDLETVRKGIVERTDSETFLDEIKIRILQDNDSEVFFVSAGILSNMVADFLFSLNKIAIYL